MANNPEIADKAPETTSGKALCPKCKTPLDKGAQQCPQCNTLIFIDSKGVEERLRRIESYSVGQLLLHEREYLFESVCKREKLLQKILYCGGYALLFAALYGAILGSHSGLAGSVAMGGKVPLVLMATLLVCLPILFIFNVFVGTRLSMLQVVTLMLLSTYLISLGLIAFTPILGMFIVYSENLALVHLLNFIFIVIAGALGIGLLWGGMGYCAAKNYRKIPSLIVYTWSTIYVFVLLQTAWTLNFFGDMVQLPIFKQLNLEGDFYTALFELVKKLMGGD
jgi:hypothetical protein